MENMKKSELHISRSILYISSVRLYTTSEKAGILDAKKPAVVAIFYCDTPP